MSIEDKFGRKGDAEAILEQAKQRVEGQKMSDENLKKAQERMVEQADRDHTTEAAAFTEETIVWMNDQWNEREFTPEQRVFSLALTFINFSEHFPAEKGGPDEFVRIYKEARKYFDSNR